MINTIKFVLVLIGLGLIYTYLPFGQWICMIVNLVALWKLVCD